MARRPDGLVDVPRIGDEPHASAQRAVPVVDEFGRDPACEPGGATSRAETAP